MLLRWCAEATGDKDTAMDEGHLINFRPGRGSGEILDETGRTGVLIPFGKFRMRQKRAGTPDKDRAISGLLWRSYWNLLMLKATVMRWARNETCLGAWTQVSRLFRWDWR